jgi:hypothetical protein
MNAHLSGEPRCPVCGKRGYRRIARIGDELIHWCRAGHPHYVPQPVKWHTPRFLKIHRYLFCYSDSYREWYAEGKAAEQVWCMLIWLGQKGIVPL